jgi:LPXTG-motif cell wall-anchored protein
MREQFPPVSINFSKVDVVGWPGLALVLVAVAIALEFPQTRWLLLAGLAAGILLAAVLIVVRRRRA